VVSMKNVTFGPKTVQVKVGATVRFINDDPIAHNVVAVAGARFDSGLVKARASFVFHATKAGTIHYVCTLHQGMRGTIDVTS
jgi:plastocyanin